MRRVALVRTWEEAWWCVQADGWLRDHGRRRHGASRRLGGTLHRTGAALFGGGRDRLRRVACDDEAARSERGGDGGRLSASATGGGGDLGVRRRVGMAWSLAPDGGGGACRSACRRAGRWWSIGRQPRLRWWR